mgnify:FL=1|tara:strand:+ start:96 stop:566 length:471 start_codon:yes stop_codon:yes gene_type:complete
MNQINIELTKEQITSITKQVRDSGEADYRFDLNLLEGKLSENKWAGILETVEIKKDYKAWDTGNIAVEYASYGNPSGIAKTEAKFVAYILVDQDQDDRIVFFIKTEILLAMCRKYKGVAGRDVKGGDSYGSSLILLPIEELVNKQFLFSNQLSMEI